MGIIKIIIEIIRSLPLIFRLITELVNVFKDIGDKKERKRQAINLESAFASRDSNKVKAVCDGLFCASDVKKS